MNTFNTEQSFFEMAVRRRERRRQLVALVLIVSLTAFVVGFYLFSWIGSAVFGFTSFAAVSFLVDHTEMQESLRSRRERYAMRSATGKR